MTLDCSCPDWATMCKHVAAVLYGVGSRLDTRPDLLFVLRGVDAQELITAEMALPDTAASAAGDALADDQLSAIFGIDLDTEPDAPSAAGAPALRARRATRRGAATGARRPARAAPVRKVTAVTPPARTGTRRAPDTPSTPARRAAAPLTTDVPKIRPTGKSVARLRRQQGLSVAQFAAELGVSPTTVYRWEIIQGPLHLQARLLKALATLQQRIKDNDAGPPPGRAPKRARRA